MMYPSAWFRSGVSLTEVRRRTATDRMVAELRRLALMTGLPPDHPLTWVAVAQDLGILLETYVGGDSAGHLTYLLRHDKWVISYRSTLSNEDKVRVLVHELAHWLQRSKTADWLCDENIVFYYEGPIEDEMHRIARDVEERVLM